MRTLITVLTTLTVSALVFWPRVSGSDEPISPAKPAQQMPAVVCQPPTDEAVAKLGNSLMAWRDQLARKERDLQLKEEELKVLRNDVELRMSELQSLASYVAITSRKVEERKRRVEVARKKFETSYVRPGERSRRRSTDVSRKNGREDTGQRLLAIVKALKPKSAAKIMESIPAKRAAGILASLDAGKAAAIIQKMEPLKAAEITQYMDQVRSDRPVTPAGVNNTSQKNTEAPISPVSSLKKRKRHRKTRRGSSRAARRRRGRGRRAAAVPRPRRIPLGRSFK